MDNTTTTTIGLMPRLLLTPATAAWALPFGAYLILLSGRVFAVRLKTLTYFGDHVDPNSLPADVKATANGKTEVGDGANKTELGKTEFSAGTHKKTVAEDPDPLYLATRCLGNYLETMPVAMIFALVAELNGANRNMVSWALGVFLMAKIAHYELGLRLKGTMGYGRPIGYVTAQACLAGLSGYCAYLAKDYWFA